MILDRSQKPLIIDKVLCVTPFNVEYARLSLSRDNAPTLIPTEGEGKPVKAMILVLSNDVTRTQAESMLWRRETRTTDITKNYTKSSKPSINTVLINCVNNFISIEEVL